MAAVNNTWEAIKYLSKNLQNDKEVAIAAVRENGSVWNYLSKDLQNDKKVAVATVRENSSVWNYLSKDLQNDKEVAVAFVRENGSALKYLSKDLQNNKEVVMTAVQNNGIALRYASPRLQNEKGVVAAAVRCYPDAIKTIHKDRSDVLIAAGMYDERHPDAVARQQFDMRKIVLSTRFSLDPKSWSEVNNFTALFKKSKFYNDGKFIVYAPNAKYKQTCDKEWTRFDWPCRGTEDTCQYRNILTDEGNPTDDCCWRYSFRNQLQDLS